MPKFWLLVLLLLTLVSPIWAAEVTGDLLVEVYSEESDEPIEGAVVVIQDREKRGDAVEVRTGADGTVRVKNLPTGQYSIEVQHPDHGSDGAVVRVTSGVGNRFAAFLVEKSEDQVVVVRDQRLLVNTKDPNAGARTERNRAPPGRPRSR